MGPVATIVLDGLFRHGWKGWIEVLSDAGCDIAYTPEIKVNGPGDGSGYITALPDFLAHIIVFGTII